MKEFTTHPARFRLAFCAVLLLLLSACSTLRFTYNHGDTLLYWWLDGYVDLESDQKPQVQRDIDALFHWHRQTELRAYAALLRTAQSQLAGHPTVADLQADYAAIRTRTRALLHQSVPEMTDLALSLKPEQIAHLAEKFEKNNREYRRKFMTGSAEERKAARFERTLDQLELWFGSFSRAQQAELRRLADAQPLVNTVWLEERMRRQQQILSLLRWVQTTHPPRAELSAHIATLIDEVMARPEAPERRSFYAETTAAQFGLILRAIALATPAQRAYAQHRMQGWIDDFEALAAAPG